MKGQIKFLTPAIAGIVIGITSMITTILNKLSVQIASITEGGAANAGNLANFGSLFGNGVPAYYFQIIVDQRMKKLYVNGYPHDILLNNI